MDLAYESVHAGAQEVVLCSRGGFLSFPKILNNFSLFGMTFDGKLPIDSLITNLCESAYVHPWVAQSHLRWFVSDFVIKRVLWVLTGTQAGCNQWVGELPQERLGRVSRSDSLALVPQEGADLPYFGASRRPTSSSTSLTRPCTSSTDPTANAPPSSPGSRSTTTRRLTSQRRAWSRWLRSQSRSGTGGSSVGIGASAGPREGVG